eukprot:1159054-Pelagomonas_calceolata.AAC.4
MAISLHSAPYFVIGWAALKGRDSSSLYLYIRMHTHEPGNEKVLAQIIDWVDQRSPPLAKESTTASSVSSATNGSVKQPAKAVKQVALYKAVEWQSGAGIIGRRGHWSPFQWCGAGEATSAQVHMQADSAHRDVGESSEDRDDVGIKAGEADTNGPTPDKPSAPALRQKKKNRNVTKAGQNAANGLT